MLQIWSNGSTVMDYTKSSQSGNWELHLHSMERMLERFHKYDHTNYARHFTYCWATQKSLQEQYPLIYDKFQKGNFTVKQSQGKFNCLSPDQVIKQAVNNEQKGPGYIIGFSTTSGTVQQWVTTSHDIATISSKFKKYIGFDELKSVPKDLSTKRIMADKESVSTCYELISSWINHFEESNAIAGLSSEHVAPKDLHDNLLNVEDISAGQLKDFLATRIQSDETKFHDPIRKNKLKTHQHYQHNNCTEIRPRNFC